REFELSVRRGEVVACIGPNGAGKTTTLRAISGMIRARRGHISFAGQDVTASPAERITKLGLIHIPEGRGLFPNLSVEDTLRLVSVAAGHEVDITDAFELVPKLRERRRQQVGTLSRGGGAAPQPEARRGLLPRERGRRPGDGRRQRQRPPARPRAHGGRVGPCAAEAQACAGAARGVRRPAGRRGRGRPAGEGGPAMKRLFIALNCAVVGIAAVVLLPAFALADVPSSYTSFGYATGVHGIAGSNAFPNFQNGAVNNRYPMA